MNSSIQILMCIDTIADMNNCNRFINNFNYFFILNIIFEPIKIIHLNSISIHLQIRYVPEYYLFFIPN
jgi:hypothetical protein